MQAKVSLDCEDKTASRIVIENLIFLKASDIRHPYFSITCLDVYSAHIHEIIQG